MEHRPLDSEALKHGKRLEAVLTAATETSRGLEVLQYVRSLQSARGFAEELIRLGGDPGRLMFEVDGQDGWTHLAALDLLAGSAGETSSGDLTQLPDGDTVVAELAPGLSPEERELVATSAVLEMLRTAGRSERQVIERLIGWAMAFDDIEGMDAEDTALYERLISLREDDDAKPRQ